MVIHYLQVAQFTLVDPVTQVIVLLAAVLLVDITLADQVPLLGTDPLEHSPEEFTHLLLQLWINNLIPEIARQQLNICVREGDHCLKV